MTDFVSRVLECYPFLKEDVSLDAFVSDIEEKQKEGWEFRDVLSYLRTFEEISPEPIVPPFDGDGDEEFYLRREAAQLERRAIIESKYLNKHIELYDVRFASLAPLLSK